MKTFDPLYDFPRGLVQPEQSFKFSADALLLAAFMKQYVTHETFIDLGTGCGVVAFSLLRSRPTSKAIGIDIQKELIQTAQINAQNMMLGERFIGIHADVCNLFQTPEHGIKKNTYTLAVANPPYRIAKQGRLPTQKMRTTALFGNEDTLITFCSTSAQLLKTKGRLGMAFSANRLPELLSALQKNSLAPKRLLFVHGNSDKKAFLVLIEAQKGVKTNLCIEAPLILYSEGKCTEKALQFCPELSCNI